jgi:hypothetical protein
MHAHIQATESHAVENYNVLLLGRFSELPPVSVNFFPLKHNFKEI